MSLEQRERWRDSIGEIRDVQTAGLLFIMISSVQAFE